jgi:hypothetical protein
MKIDGGIVIGFAEEESCSGLMIIGMVAGT